jgi:hypothetical protein
MWPIEVIVQINKRGSKLFKKAGRDRRETKPCRGDRMNQELSPVVENVDDEPESVDSDSLASELLD